MKITGSDTLWNHIASKICRQISAQRPYFHIPTPVCRRFGAGNVGLALVCQYSYLKLKLKFDGQ
jgi:hypothetical protein